jgi:hypothetical protein
MRHRSDALLRPGLPGAERLTEYHEVDTILWHTEIIGQANSDEITRESTSGAPAASA